MMRKILNIKFPIKSSYEYKWYKYLYDFILFRQFDLYDFILFRQLDTLCLHWINKKTPRPQVVRILYRNL